MREKNGAGDRGRTGDVQLGNFLLKMTFFILGTRSYPRFCALKIFFLRLVISTSFDASTFVLGTFWARQNAAKTPCANAMYLRHQRNIFSIEARPRDVTQIDS